MCWLFWMFVLVTSLQKTTKTLIIIPPSPNQSTPPPPCRAYPSSPLGFPLRYWRESSVVRSSPATKKPPIGKLRVATKNIFFPTPKNRDRQKDIKKLSSWHWWHFENIQESINVDSIIYIYIICGFLNHLILWHPVIKWSCCFFDSDQPVQFFLECHISTLQLRNGEDEDGILVLGSWFHKALIKGNQLSISLISCGVMLGGVD